MSTVAALSRRGHEITLLLPRGRDDPEVTTTQLKEYFGIDGDFLVQQLNSRWEGDALFRTALWLRQCVRALPPKKFDIFYSRIPAMIGLGSMSPIPFVTDHYKPWPDVYPVIAPLVRRTARSPHCLGFIVHSRYAAGSYLRVGISPDQLLVAHNGVDDVRESRPDKAQARARLSLPPAQKIVAYAGRVNASKGLDQVLALAALMPEVLFLIIGSEGEGPVEKAASNHVNVWVVPWQTRAQLPVWLAAADVLVIPPSLEPLNVFGNCVLPIKLFDYLAAGRPILAPVSPDTAELLSHCTNAYLVPPVKPEASVAALQLLFNDTALSSQIACGALEQARACTWDARAENIEGFLNQRLEHLANFSPARGR
ncbi:glycosyltransferase [Novosphingobium aquae]|uniref:Glycosyltransferase n=1 Tax=Novosphingobium aquae TaxID=3133435 RepID=A0ABU8S7E8_9SPHN